MGGLDELWNSAGRVGGAISDGFSSGVGTRPLGFSEGVTQAFRDWGLYGPAGGGGSALQFVNEAVIGQTAGAVDATGRLFSGGYQALQGGAYQGMVEVGVPTNAARDIVSVPDAFMGSMGGAARGGPARAAGAEAKAAGAEAKAAGAEGNGLRTKHEHDPKKKDAEDLCGCKDNEKKKKKKKEEEEEAKKKAEAEAAAKAKAAKVGDLSPAEQAKIQKNTDKLGGDVYVTGSAARGERRGIGSDMPLAGFGESKLGTRSDIDYAVAPRFDDAANALDLPDVDPSFGVRGVDYINLDSGPVIRFSPDVSPEVLTGTGRLYLE